MLRQEAPEGAARLGCAPLGFACSLRFQNHFFAFCSGNAVQDLIRSVLNARAGAMKFACRLRGELAKGVTIAQRMNCFKNQFRPHDFSSCRMNDVYSAQSQSSFRRVLAVGTDLLPAAGDTAWMLCAGSSVRFFARLDSILTGLKSATVRSRKLYLVLKSHTFF